MRRHKIKKETTATFSKKQENDLVYYIHDRVELMHQVFSLLKSKEIKSIAPDCVRNISVDDLEELCLEELLGISSKRLLAILDGAEPPSDTSSSDSEHSQQLETISLDSLRSEDEEYYKIKNKRCRRRESSKRLKRSTPAAPASGATVLELLELQARARAIRAQLAAEHKEKEAAVGPTSVSSSADDDDVIIKEETPDVVELSTDEDEPAGSQEKEVDPTILLNKKIDVVKPQNQPKRIKLNRTKPTTPNVKIHVVEPKVNENIVQIESNLEIPQKVKEKGKRKVLSNDKEKENSDHDEITLQLSDTEQLELEEFDKNKYNKKISVSSDSDIGNASIENLHDKFKQLDNDVMLSEEIKNINDVHIEKHLENKETCNSNNINSYDTKSTDKINDSKETTLKECEKPESVLNTEKEIGNSTEQKNVDNMALDDQNKIKKISINKDAEELNKDKSSDKSQNRSDGELSRRSSSEVEAFDVPQVVVCISDEEKIKKLKKKKSKKEKKNDKKNKDFRKDGDENFYKDSEFIDNKYFKEDTIEINKEPISIDSDQNYELYEISDDSSCYEVEGVSVLSKEPTSEEIEAFSAKIDHEFERQEVITDEEIRNHESNVKNVNKLENHCENLENVSWKDRYLSSTKVKKVLCASNILNAIRKKNIELKKKIQEIKRVADIPQIVIETESKVNSIEEGTMEHFNTLQGSSKYVKPSNDISRAENKDSEIENKKTEVKETETSDENSTINIEHDRQASQALIRDARQLLKMYKKLLKQCGIVDTDKERKKKTKKTKEVEKI